MAQGRNRYSVISDGLPSQIPDVDPAETQEWVDSLDGVIDSAGPRRARFLMLKLLERAREKQVGVPALRSTDYVNTIPAEAEPWFPGDEFARTPDPRLHPVERGDHGEPRQHPDQRRRPHRHVRVERASLYEVGFNHFFRGKEGGESGDQVFIQGHGSPGIYARAYLEGRLTTDQLDGFRQEISHDGLPSYPHPRLMPQFWEFPTVSMGLSPISAIYQARFNRYLHDRQLKDTSRSHVWASSATARWTSPSRSARSASRPARSSTT